MTRSHHPRWRRARGLAALAVPLALAAGVLPASGTAVAEPATPTPTTATTGSADQHPTVQSLSLPGLHDDSYAVTLLTGDQVRLTATEDGHYSIAAIPRPESGGSVAIRGQSNADGADTVLATPSAAQFLIASDQVDEGLFDVRYLATHGYTDDAGKALPVTVRYNGHPDDATITRDASGLPASELVAADARTATAKVAVDPRHLADFWAALTGTPNNSPQGQGSGGLADGIDRVWLTGHATSVPPRVQPNSGRPLYTVTLTMSLQPGELGSQLVFCNQNLHTFCAPYEELIGLTPDNAGWTSRASFSCVDSDPCTTQVARFSVPAGAYMLSASTLTAFFRDGRQEQILAAAPQVAVSHDTDIRLDLANLREVTVHTPRASDPFDAVLGWQRGADSGTGYEFVFGAYGYHSYWMLPTEQPVTVGAFHVSTAWALGAPPVTMRVDQQQDLALHPRYIFYSELGYHPADREPIVRFSGQQRLEVVDASYGRPQDFASIDARGKLAVLRIASAGPWGLSGGACYPGSLGHVMEWQLANALKAGAVGVLVDPRNPDEVPDGWCQQSAIFYEGSEPRPNIPFATLRPSEAFHLEGLLGHDTVRVTVDDSGESAYLYNLKFYQERGIPRSLRYDVTAKQVTTATINYHSDSAEPAWEYVFRAGVRRYEYTVGATHTALALPASRTEYFGPVSPDLVYDSQVQVNDTSTHTLNYRDVFDQRGDDETRDVDARPVSPGAPVLDPTVLRAQPGRWVGPSGARCALCRQGNALIPAVHLVQGNRRAITGYLLNPDASHLYLGDTEIAARSVFGKPGYVLPPEQHTYRLVTDYDNQDFGHTHADWTFSSAAPEHDQTPPGTVCPLARVGVSDEPCRADPFVFLSYDLGVALDDTLAAPSVGRFTVTASHQATDAPAIRDLKVWTSTDDGEHWKQALVLPRGRGSHGSRDFSVLTGVPELSQTTGTLSIKAQATDAQGNSITQTLTQAVKLTQRTGWGWGWPGHLTWQ